VRASAVDRSIAILPRLSAFSLAAQRCRSPLSENLDLKIVHVLSKPPADWSGERRRLDLLERSLAVSEPHPFAPALAPAYPVGRDVRP
jgi:hypothetical protein